MPEEFFTGLYTLRGCWFWSKKLHFQKNVGRNFIVVEGGTVVSNLSELHKAHVTHHWRFVGIPIFSQEVKHADASTVVNYHLCNHHFRNLYKIKESGDEEKTLFAAATRKHQSEGRRLIVLLRALELRQLSLHCGMPFYPLLCMCALRALPLSWVSLTTQRGPENHADNNIQ